MSHRKGHYRNKPRVGDKAKQVLENIDETNPIIQMFKGFAAQLNDKHDRYERIVKLSRDITIESKRIIFLLHSAETDIESKRDQIFTEAQTRLDKLVETNFKAIASELDGFDSHQYLRAYTAGLQEFIEALMFYQFLKTEVIQEWSVINDQFSFTLEDGKTVKLLFPQVEYLLGLADFTGELMRKCINNLSAGKIEDSFKICEFVKYIHTGFLGVNTTGCKEIHQKLWTLTQSLNKMETVCYNIKVRGSEVPKHMLGLVSTAALEDTHPDVDEGFF